MTNNTSMCIFKSQLIDKGTNKVTKENVVFDTTSSRYDLAIKEVEERVKLGWSVKASFMLGGGYLRVDYVRADPNRYKDVGKTNESKVDAEIVNTGSVVVGATEADSESSGYGGMDSVGCEESVEVATQEVVATAAPIELAEVKEVDVKETPVKPARKSIAATKKSEVKDA